MRKIKENMGYFILSLLLTLIPLFIGLALWDKLPDQVPIHFDVHGNVDNYASKEFAVYFLSLFMLLMQVFLAFVTGLDPKNEKKNVNTKIYRLMLFIIPITNIFVSLLMYGPYMSLEFDVNSLMNIFLGVLFLVIGNYMPKTRRNYTIGIKLPWTMNDDDNWDKTNRLGGYLTMICGILFILNGFLRFVAEEYNYILVVALALSLLVIPTIYSYLYYRKHGVHNEEE